MRHTKDPVPATRLGGPGGGWRRVAALVPVLALGAAAPAVAQRFGQWSWDGRLAAETHDARSELDGDELGTLDQRELRLELGLEGYVVHPAIAAFRLSGSTGLTDVETTRSRRRRRWGFGADVYVLPRGARSLRLYARRQLHDETLEGVEDPTLLIGFPETETSFGGRLRLRHGLLQGSLIGYDRTAIGYRGTARGLTGREQAFYQWERPDQDLRQHFRLERRADQFGFSGYATDVLTLNYDHRAKVGSEWTWQSANVGARRRIELSGSRSGFDSVRSSQVLRRPFGENALDLRYDLGLAASAGIGSQSHGLQARYWWRPGPAWSLSPVLGYSLQRSGPRSVTSPQVGVAAHWKGSAGPIGLDANNALSFLLLDRAGPEGEGTDSTLALDVALTARHGEREGLGKELEVAWSRNRLQVAGEGLSELPEIVPDPAGVGTEDALRGRLTLRWRWRGLSFFGYSEAARRTPSGTFAVGRARIDRWTHTLQVTSGRLSLTANTGSVRVAAIAPQRADNWSAALTWRPLRLLSLGGAYRSDRRRLTLSPDLDVARLEARADFWLGAFLLRGQWYQTRERSLDGFERRNDSLVLSLSRAFGGWLPIVTAPPPGGVIR